MTRSYTLSNWDGGTSARQRQPSAYAPPAAGPSTNAITTTQDNAHQQINGGALAGLAAYGDSEDGDEGHVGRQHQSVASSSTNRTDKTNALDNEGIGKGRVATSSTTRPLYAASTQSVHPFNNLPTYATTGNKERAGGQHALTPAYQMPPYTTTSSLGTNPEDTLATPKKQPSSVHPGAQFSSSLSTYASYTPFSDGKSRVGGQQASKDTYPTPPHTSAPYLGTSADKGRIASSSTVSVHATSLQAAQSSSYSNYMFIPAPVFPQRTEVPSNTPSSAPSAAQQAPPQPQRYASPTRQPAAAAPPEDSPLTSQASTPAHSPVRRPKPQEQSPLRARSPHTPSPSTPARATSLPPISHLTPPPVKRASTPLFVPASAPSTPRSTCLELDSTPPLSTKSSPLSEFAALFTPPPARPKLVPYVLVPPFPPGQGPLHYTRALPPRSKGRPLVFRRRRAGDTDYSPTSSDLEFMHGPKRRRSTAVVVPVVLDDSEDEDFMPSGSVARKLRKRSARVILKESSSEEEVVLSRRARDDAHVGKRRKKDVRRDREESEEDEPEWKEKVVTIRVPDRRARSPSVQLLSASRSPSVEILRSPSLEFMPAPRPRSVDLGPVARLPSVEFVPTLRVQASTSASVARVPVSASEVRPRKRRRIEHDGQVKARVDYRVAHEYGSDSSADVPLADSQRSKPRRKPSEDARAQKRKRGQYPPRHDAEDEETRETRIAFAEEAEERDESEWMSEWRYWMERWPTLQEDREEVAAEVEEVVAECEREAHECGMRLAVHTRYRTREEAAVEVAGAEELEMIAYEHTQEFAPMEESPSPAKALAYSQEVLGPFLASYEALVDEGMFARTMATELEGTLEGMSPSLEDMSISNSHTRSSSSTQALAAFVEHEMYAGFTINPSLLGGAPVLDPEPTTPTLDDISPVARRGRDDIDLGVGHLDLGHQREEEPESPRRTRHVHVRRWHGSDVGSGEVSEDEYVPAKAPKSKTTWYRGGKEAAPPTSPRKKPKALAQSASASTSRPRASASAGPSKPARPPASAGPSSASAAVDLSRPVARGVYVQSESVDRFCHQCRRRTRYPKMRCGAGCDILFCIRCIEMRYADIVFDDKRTDWLCPRCEERCNCTSCARKRGERYIGPRSVDTVAGAPAARKALRFAPKSKQRRKRQDSDDEEWGGGGDDEAWGGGANADDDEAEKDNYWETSSDDAYKGPAVDFTLPVGMSWGTLYGPNGEVFEGVVGEGNKVIVPDLAVPPTPKPRKPRTARKRTRLEFVGALQTARKALPDPQEDVDAAFDAHLAGKRDPKHVGEGPRRRWYVGNPAALRWRVKPRTPPPPPRLPLPPDPYEPKCTRSESPLSALTESDAETDGDADGGAGDETWADGKAAADAHMAGIISLALSAVTTPVGTPIS